MQEIELKRGDTFLMSCTYSDNADLPIDITNVTIKSQVRDAQGVLLQELVVTKLDQVTNKGKFTLGTVSGYSFPLGRHSWDIEYTSNGQVQSTETIFLNIIQDITKV